MPHRPIVGHRTQLVQLEQDLAQDNLAHAYLFSGPPHVGKTTVVHRFARQILTSGLEEERRADVLRQMERLVHPDLLALDALWIEKKQEDWEVIARSSNIDQQHRAKKGHKTDTISIDDVRAIGERLHATGALAHRVCIISNVERMQLPAVSAFLKTLEEPLPGRVFLLTSSEPASLSQTVLSRVRQVRFGRVGNAEMQSLLSGESEENRSFLLHCAQGAPGRVVRLMEDAELLRAERLAHAQAAAFWGADTLHARLMTLAPLASRGAESDRLLFHLGLALRILPAYRPAQEHAFTQLVTDVQTNAYRPIVIQRFAAEVGGR